jgi:hypothetical protein
MAAESRSHETNQLGIRLWVVSSDKNGDLHLGALGQLYLSLVNCRFSHARLNQLPGQLGIQRAAEIITLSFVASMAL